MRVLLTLLLAVPLVTPSAPPLAPLPVALVRANDLTDRIATSRERQQGLIESIERQRDLLQDLGADEDLAGLALDTSAEALDGINADQSAVRADIQRASDALARVEARHESLVLELGRLDETIQALEVQIAQGDIDLAQRRSLLGDRLVLAYRTSQTSLLEQLLGAGSFSEVLVGVDAHLRFGEQDAEFARLIEQDQASLDALRSTTLETRAETDQLRLETVAAGETLRIERERLAAARRRLAKMEERTRQLRSAQQDEFDHIATEQDDAQAAIARHQASEEALRADIADLVAEAQRRAEARERRLELERQRRLEARAQRREEREAREAREALEARQQRMQRERRHARQAQEEREAREERQEREASPPPAPRPPSPPPAPRPPRPDGPLDWPAVGYVTQEYGCTGFYLEPPRGSCAHYHDGIDIANGEGTPIRAAAAGVVAFVGYNPYDSGGDRAWVVSIGHAGSLSTWYSHLQPRYAPGVRRGSRVRQGQLIGYMGNTGKSTGAHLHWEVLRGGTDVNPRSLL